MERISMWQNGSMLNKIFAYLVVFVTIAPGASAEIYKCVNDDGVVKFSDQPCGRQAEVFISKTDLSVDEAVGNGGPYPEPVKNSAVMNQDIMVHAKTVGASIFPGMDPKSDDMGEEITDRTRSWRVFLAYRDPKIDYKYANVELNYTGEKVGDRIFVRLHYIRISRFDWMVPLPTLKKTKKLKRDSCDGWYVLPQRK